MFAAVERDGGIFRPSAFWRALAEEQADQLEASGGVANVKRTLARRYFTWIGGLRSDQFRALARMMDRSDWREVLRDPPKWTPDCGLSRWRWLNQWIFTRMLWRYAIRIDRMGLLDRLEEPAFGNPYPIHYRGKLISQDLANSAIELYAMFEGAEIDLEYPLRVCEIGAGYGRNAFVFLTLFPNCSYTIIDIPPALYVAREYLKAVCPEAKVEFLLPHEAQGLGAGSFDLLLNISSFHEMIWLQVDAYFGLIDRILSGRLYLKQWRRWHNPADDITMSEESYPYRPGWTKLYSRTAAAQPSFFEAVYRVG